MSTELLQELAQKLALDAIEQERATGDDGIVDAVAKSLADTSTTFQEAFLTAIRYYRAEARARALLPNATPMAHASDAAPDGPIALPPPEESEKPTDQPAEDETAEAADETAAEEPDAPTPDEEDIPYAEAEVVDEEDDAQFDTGSGTADGPHVGLGGKIPKPKIGTEPGAETPAEEPEITGPRKRRR